MGKWPISLETKKGENRTGPKVLCDCGQGEGRFPWRKGAFFVLQDPASWFHPLPYEPLSSLTAPSTRAAYTALFPLPLSSLPPKKQTASKLSSPCPLSWAARHSHLSAAFFSSKTRSPQPVMFPEGCGGSNHSCMPECSKGQKRHRGPGQTQSE